MPKYRDLRMATDRESGARIIQGVRTGSHSYEKVSGPFPDYDHAELSLRRLQLKNGLGNAPNIRKRIEELTKRGVRG